MYFKLRHYPTYPQLPLTPAGARMTATVPPPVAALTPLPWQGRGRGLGPSIPPPPATLQYR